MSRLDSTSVRTSAGRAEMPVRAHLAAPDIVFTLNVATAGRSAATRAIRCSAASQQNAHRVTSSEPEQSADRWVKVTALVRCERDELEYLGVVGGVLSLLRYDSPPGAVVAVVVERGYRYRRDQKRGW